jgi:hypothetical protein
MARNTSKMPNADRDNESGQYTETYPTEQFIEAVGELAPAGTSDVAEAVGCRYETAYKKLQQLDTEGRVNRNKIGNSLIWSLD